MNSYLERSPIRSDGGNLIGKHPNSLSLEEMRELCPHNSVIRALRDKCLDCCNDSPAEVRKCIAADCPIWLFRMGTNPLHGKGIKPSETD